ncbi:SubName: Full=Uncharacterized protein {ECO:0000313/EMBL:CCA67504.1} [Serendipita indica DSM 11827]|uniref:Uncharacterized protein n=1 Tax=Serendipita indica (strain DSM 11827) TaxID=1109443 RepID=G4T885_SERID|nr:SubName: Full=Uncharacterized protein {ECO:0000313/EMBL:CCA67504.1} [Serendipita indica DSM 11827]CCA67504.1 hypothetical protein PIIN_01333 [Serendipita indica DSM 11827]
MPRSVRAPLRQVNGSDGESDQEISQYASPASRLRAAMSRLGPSTPPDRRITTASESDSDLNPVFSARKSLKDVFSRAMRDNDDSPDSKLSSLPPDAQVVDDESQVSDSDFQVSSQGTSLQLLRHRLEIPEMSSRMDVSSSMAKPGRSQKSLHHLLQTAQDESAAQDNESVDTARADPPKDEDEEQNITEDQVNTPANRSRAHIEFHTPSPPSGIPDLPAPPKSDDDDSFLHVANKTPRPPGGWFTPVRHAENSQLASPSLVGRTPAPPGAWQATPVPSETRKSGYKVRFSEESFSKPRPSDATAHEGNQSSEQRITLVDSFGRELQEENDGEDGAIKIVDSLGNEIERSLAAEMSEAFDQNEPVTIEGVQSKISDIRQGLQQVESRQTISHHRRVVKQRAIPHDRILELAMGSREARIEREKLLRQSHLVRARTEELATLVNNLKPAVETSVPASVSRHVTWRPSRTFIIWMLLFDLVLFYIIYFFARAYIQHYFLTSHYDPAFAMVDPSRLHGYPFLQTILLHGHWRKFVTQSSNLLGNPNGLLPSVLSLPLDRVVRDLPS